MGSDVLMHGMISSLFSFSWTMGNLSSYLSGYLSVCPCHGISKCFLGIHITTVLQREKERTPPSAKTSIGRISSFYTNIS